MESKKTYVCHGSTGEKEMTSTVEKFCLGRTRILFSCDGYRMRYYDLWRDPGERATSTFSLATNASLRPRCSPNDL